ncbi:MAG: response regulator [Polyangiales bacterium]
MKPVAVLVVDDSEIDRYLLTRDLTKIGLGDHVFEASDGLEALEFLSNFDENKAQFGARFPPDVILLDINMPRMGGFEFLERLVALRDTRKAYETLVVLMFSSSEHPNEHHFALHQDIVTDFVVKGAITSEELKEKIRMAHASGLKRASS